MLIGNTCTPLQYETKEQLYEHMTECDIIVYDITEDPDQIDEAVWAVSGIFVELYFMHFVLSTI